MNTEYEATFTQINKNQLRKKLMQVGAVLVKPETLMKRVTYKPPLEIKGGWMRVRDEGDKITLSLKIVNGVKITDQKEIEIIINDFNSGCQLLKTIGAERKSYQETTRELWHYQNCDITLDTWPGLKPLIEIEGPNKKIVQKVSEKLGFNWTDAYFGATGDIYEKELGIPLDVINNQTPLITFKNPPRKFKK